MKHRRAHEFDEALLKASEAERWRTVSRDPNDALALAVRSRTLAAAWRPPAPDRIEFIESRVAGLSVLDIGCVAHDVTRFDSPNWLHGRIVAASDRCVGVDVDAVGVQAMVERGYSVVHHDLTTGTGALRASAPFDVVVAGELIEHVGNLDFLFQTALEVLTAHGHLILTTPNPYSPDRVWAGQRGVGWENTDHVAYAFPAGIAELASRHGMRLQEAMTTARTRPRWVSRPARSLKQALRGTGWHPIGFATVGGVRTVRVRRLRWLTDLTPQRSRRFLGESFIYVIGRQ